MGGSPSYSAPGPDPSQVAYNNYMLEHQKTLDKKAQDKEDQDTIDLNATKATGQTGYNTFLNNLHNQYNAGLIDSKGASDQLQNYSDKYKLGTGFSQKDINDFTTQYTQDQPGNLQKLAGQTYKDILGREATASEIQSYQDLAKTGQYKLADLTNTIKSGKEYQNKFNDNYLSSYYDTMYGKQGTTTVDGIETKTGQRTFNYNPAFDPTFAGDLTKSTGINTSTIPLSVTGTPAEIQAFQDSQRQKRDFMYNAGLTNLQGQIDKDVQKIKDEGTQAVAKIGTQGQLLSNLTAGFWN